MYYLVIVVAVFIGVSIPSAIQLYQSEKRNKLEARLLDAIRKSMLLDRKH